MRGDDVIYKEFVIPHELFHENRALETVRVNSIGFIEEYRDTHKLKRIYEDKDTNLMGVKFIVELEPITE